MGETRTIDNPVGEEQGFALGAIAQYYKSREEYEKEMQAEVLIQTGIALIQMILYWGKLDKMLDKRDEIIDDEMKFMDRLRAAQTGTDLQMLRDKAAILGNLPEPTAEICFENVRYATETINDGNAVDKSARRFTKESCCGIPFGWGLHDGDLVAALSVPIGGSFQAAHADRREQEFRKNKAGLLQAAQKSIKSVFSASSILAYYDRAANIYQGIADIYIQGFNSAGAALGTALGKLSNAQSAPTNTASSSTIQIGHTGTGQVVR